MVSLSLVACHVVPAVSPSVLAVGCFVTRFLTMCRFLTISSTLTQLPPPTRTTRPIARSHRQRRRPPPTRGTVTSLLLEGDRVPGVLSGLRATAGRRRLVVRPMHPLFVLL